MSLIRWITKKFQSAAEPGGKPRHSLSNMSLDETIAAIAAQRNELAIQATAHQFTQRFGPEVIPELTRRFDVMIEPPPSFSTREPSVCAWFSCWSFTIFEILYQYREHALPVLWEMARIGHNGAAIVLLCRLAAEGVDRQQIVANLQVQMPDLLYSVRCDVAERLLSLSRKNPALTAVVDDLRKIPAFEEALVEVRQDLALS